MLLMTILLGLALVMLGLAIGFALAWVLGVNAWAGWVLGIALLITGAIIGFIVEWLIDEAYRKNRELRWQLRQQEHAPVSPLIQVATPGRLLHPTEGGSPAPQLASGTPHRDFGSETLADFLRQRETELREMRQQLTEADGKTEALRLEYEAYQRSHPDTLTVIKGIGPVYQWKLRDAGISTYKQLAKADPEQLRRMLGVKSWQKVNIGAWIEQARDWAQRGG
jgi:predicted flap endonuclease-1-like 5' DNA nuclease